MKKQIFVTALLLLVGTSFSVFTYWITLRFEHKTQQTLFQQAAEDRAITIQTTLRQQLTQFNTLAQLLQDPTAALSNPEPLLKTLIDAQAWETLWWLHEKPAQVRLQHNFHKLIATPLIQNANQVKTPIISPHVALEDGQVGVLVLLATPTKLLIGELNLAKLFERHLALLSPRGIDIRLYDITSNTHADTLNSHPSRRSAEATTPPFFKHQLSRYRQSFSLGHRSWEVLCTPLPGFYNEQFFWMPWVLLSLGLLSTLLLILYWCAIYEKQFKIACTVAQRTAQLKQALSLLETQQKTLELNNAELQAFNHLVSHDLQEPLRMITSYLALLKKRHWESTCPPAREFIELAEQGAQRLQQMIKELLSYTHLDQEAKPLHATSTTEAYQWAVANLELLIQEANATLECQPLPVILGDLSQIKQLFQNLIENSLKYRANQPIQIRVSAKPASTGFWEFCIEDNGPGIPENAREEVLLLFRRVAAVNPVQGNGIGLALCKRIVTRHGGGIWIEASKLGGASIHFTLRAENDAQ